jgi:protein-disulfide isomerase
MGKRLQKVARRAARRRKRRRNGIIGVVLVGGVIAAFAVRPLPDPSLPALVAVEDQMREAFGHGFRGTPSFMINDTPLAGPPSYEYLISVIEGQLN